MKRSFSGSLIVVLTVLSSSHLVQAGPTYTYYGRTSLTVTSVTVTGRNGQTTQLQPGTLGWPSVEVLAGMNTPGGVDFETASMSRTYALDAGNRAAVAVAFTYSYSFNVASGDWAYTTASIQATLSSGAFGMSNPSMNRGPGASSSTYNGILHVPAGGGATQLTLDLSVNALYDPPPTCGPITVPTPVAASLAGLGIATVLVLRRRRII